MNKVILMGRLTRDPEVRYSGGDNSSAYARYTLAVDRRYKRNDDDNTDFISCVAFGKGAEFAEKYLRKGTKIAVVGRLQTGSYTNKDGQKVYTTDVVVEEHDFAESKSASQQSGNNNYGQNQQSRQQGGGYGGTQRQQERQPQQQSMFGSSSDGFMNIPDDIDEELPFN